MKRLILIATLFLVACGTEEPKEPIVLEGQYTGEKLVLEKEGCSWEVSETTFTEDSLIVGEYVLPYRYSTKEGPVYSLQEGGVTRWVHVVGSVMNVGIKCEK
ncbi:MAG TPA: hypothetical protein V6C65_38895 [Allocoleopsis sp.]